MTNKDEQFHTILEKISKLTNDFGTHLAIHEVDIKRRDEDVKESKEWKTTVTTKLDNAISISSRIEQDLYNPDSGVVKQHRALWEKFAQLRAIWWAIGTIGGTVVYLVVQTLGLNQEQPIQITRNYETQQQYDISR
jgi:hypothetical protein